MFKQRRIRGRNITSRSQNMLLRIWTKGLHGGDTGRWPVVALPRRRISWLSLNVEDLKASLERLGCQVVFYGDLTGGSPRKNNGCFPSILNDALHYATAVESESTSKNVVSAHPGIADRWRNKLVIMFSSVKHHLLTERPDLVVLLQGYEPLSASARAAAIELGIPLLSLENTAHSNRVVWDNVSGITTNKSLAKNYYWKYRNSLSEAEVSMYGRSNMLELNKHKSEEHRSPETGKSLICSEPYVLFLGQVLTDTSIVFGLKAWESPLQIMVKLSHWCDANGYRLVIKLHPKENNGRDPINYCAYSALTYRKIADNEFLSEKVQSGEIEIDADNSRNTYTLIEKSDFVVTVNSQAGLEAALLGKVVVVCGEAFYSDVGFTLEAPAPELLENQLERARRPMNTAGAAEFAYIYFERYCVPKTHEAIAALIGRTCYRRPETASENLV